MTLTPQTPPVIFLIFNRPELTRQAFEAIRAAKPSKLLVVADGPRANKPQDAEKCEAVRAIIDGVDWDCDVVRNFSDYNMGCRLRVSSGITWAFELVDHAIILEDDCLPSSSFFPYCAELLQRYEYDNRIMVISGNNRLFGRSDTTNSYYFTRFPHIWGWATWRRAWSEYDLDMTHWPEIKERNLFHQYFATRSESNRWDSILQSVYDGKVDTWDYQWGYSIWANSGLCITPARNMVRNIGFHAEATHTTRRSIYSTLRAEELTFPLSHPETVLASSDRDELEARLRSTPRKVLWYLLNKHSPALHRQPQ